MAEAVPVAVIEYCLAHSEYPPEQARPVLTVVLVSAAEGCVIV